MPCFSELFCRRRGLDPQRYIDALFWASLYRRAWWLASLRFFARDYFEPDYQLIRGVGRARTLEEVRSELADFAAHPANRGILRRRLKLRVSGGRLYRLAADIFAAGEGEQIHSGSPFQR